MTRVLTIAETVLQIAAKHFAEPVTPDSRLADLGDDLQRHALVMAVEDTLDFEVTSDAEFEALQTLNDLSVLAETRLGEREAA